MDQIMERYRNYSCSTAAKAQRFGTAKGALQDKLIIIPNETYIYLLKCTIADPAVKLHLKMSLVIKYLLSLSWKMAHTTRRPTNLISSSKALLHCERTRRKDMNIYLSCTPKNRFALLYPSYSRKGSKQNFCQGTLL